MDLQVLSQRLLRWMTGRTHISTHNKHKATRLVAQEAVFQLSGSSLDPSRCFFHPETSSSRIGATPIPAVWPSFPGLCGRDQEDGAGVGGVVEFLAGTSPIYWN